MQDISVIIVDEKDIPITFVVNSRAKRIIARPDPVTGGVKITLPRASAKKEALRFIQTQHHWIRRNLKHLKKNEALIDKNEIFFIGKNYQINRIEDGRFGVRMTDGVLYISGRPEHHERRLNDFLKAAFLNYLKQKCRDYSDAIGKRPARVSVKNINTRWGSCSSAGNLAFAYKLAFAPMWVIDYVIVHEMAHLVEMNHGDDFWAIVRRIYGDPTRPKAWLKAHGHTLG